MTFEDAQRLTQNGHGHWHGRKTVILGPDRTLKVTWDKLQSGSYGPLVMQVVT